MSQLSAEEALRYVTSRDVLTLIGVILLGGMLMLFGTGWMAPWHNPGTGPLLVALVSLLVFFTGVALQVGGVLALFYKIIHDATA